MDYTADTDALNDAGDHISELQTQVMMLNAALVRAVAYLVRARHDGRLRIEDGAEYDALLALATDAREFAGTAERTR